MIRFSKYYFLISFVFGLFLIGCQDDEYQESDEVQTQTQVQTPSKITYVNDNAGLLTEGQKDSLNQLLEQVDSETTTQFMIYTVSNLNGEDPAEYSDRLANQLNVGRIFINNGALIFVAVEEKNIQLRIGTGLKWQVKNQEAGAIVNQLGGYFAQGDYYGGFNNALNMLIQESNAVDWQIHYTSFEQMEMAGQNAVDKVMILSNRLVIDQISGFGGETHFQDTGEEEFNEGIYTISATSKTNRSFLLKYNRDIIPLLRQKELEPIVRLYARVTMVDPIELRVLGFQRKGDIAE